MPRKVWLIGVGGSGARTLRYAKATLERRLESLNYRGHFPSGWSLLNLDLPPATETDEALSSDLVHRREYFGIAPQGKPYRDYDASLMQARGTREFATWRPDVSSVWQAPWLGAGQFRAVGRTVLVDEMTSVRQAFDNSVESLTSTDSNKQFTDLCQLMGGGGDEEDPLVVVVGSVAGGSGSGIFLDVSDLLRTAIGHAWATTHSSILYLPSVFDALPPAARSGVEHNSYWAISELLNAAWDTSPSLPHHKGAGIAVDGLDRRGASYNFLIGRGNSNLTLTEPNAVFAAVGELLAQLALDDSFATNYNSHITGNFGASSARLRPLMLREPVPTASFGFCRFGLGRERFEEFASDRLCRSAINHVVLAHKGQARQVLGEVDTTASVDRTREEDVQHVVEANQGQLIRQFITDLGLNERGEESNDMLEAVCPTDEFEGHALAFRQEVLANSGVDGAEMLSPAAWVKRVARLSDTREGDFLAQMSLLFDANARRFSEQFPATFSEVVSNYVRRRGGWVVLELLKRLDEELTYVLTHELPSERQVRLDQSAGAAGSAQQGLEEGGKRFRGGSQVRGDHSALQDRYSYIFDFGIRGKLGAARHETAVSVLSDLVTNVLRPFRSLFTNEMARLTEYRESADFRDLSSGPVADRLRPNPTDVLLVDVDEYPEVLDELLRATIGNTADPVSDASSRMLDDAEMPEATARGARKEDSQLLALGEWQWQRGRSAETPLQHVRLSVRDLRRRSKEWMRKDPTSGLGQYLSADLAGFLETADDDQIDHFGNRLKYAILLSSPLAETDPSSLGRLYEERPGESGMTMTPLPIPQGTRGRQKAEEVLISTGVPPANVGQYFAKGAVAELAEDRIRSVSIFTSSAPVHPAVMPGFRSGVYQEWLRSGDRDNPFDFARRARSRTETIPISRRGIVQMARGWQWARFAGLVREIPSSDGAELLDGDRWRTLPVRGPEGAAHDSREYFHVAMEAFGMELLRHAETGQAEDSLRAFDVLYEMGDIDGACQKWIANGTLPSGGLGVVGAGEADSDGERRDQFKKWIDAQLGEEMAEISLSEGEGYVARRADFAPLLAEAARTWANASFSTRERGIRL